MGNSDSRHAASLDKALRYGLTQSDIDQLCKAWSAHKSESLHRNDFNRVVFGLSLPRSTALALFDLFIADATDDDHISLDELLVGLAILCKAPSDVRRKYFGNRTSSLPPEWVDDPPSLLRVDEDGDEHRVETFYEVLAGATHLHESEIAELAKHWSSITSNNMLYRIEEDRLTTLLCPPLPTSLLEGMFSAMDDNCDAQIDFRDFVTAISAACRGPQPERLKFVFKLIRGRQESDTITSADISHTLRAISQHYSSPIAISSTSSAELDISSFIEFATSADHANDVAELLILLAELMHIVLGLRPECFADERKLALSYLSRFRLSDSVQWMVISGDWWRSWLNATKPDDVIPIDNHHLLVDATTSKHVWMQLPTCTGEGGLLRDELVYTDDYRIIPSGLWTALCRWYPCEGPTLPRYVISQTNPTPHIDAERQEWFGGSTDTPSLQSNGTSNLAARRLRDKSDGRPVLELHPVTLVILRHMSVASQKTASINATIDWMKDAIWQSIGGSSANHRRVPTTSATFSCVASVDDIFAYVCKSQKVDSEQARLWLVTSDATTTHTPRHTGRVVKDGQMDVQLLLLEDGQMTLNELNIESGATMLLELRNTDLTWPEEVADESKYALNLQSARTLGVCGLNNLGNTCYINGSIQAVSNVPCIREYFISDRWKSTLNATRKTKIAADFASLLAELWSEDCKVVAPVKFNASFAKYTRHLTHGRQQDSHEFLNELLEMLDDELQSPTPSEHEIGADWSAEQKADEHWHRLPSSPIVESVYLQSCRAKQCLTCEKTETFSFEVHSYLGLNIPPGNILLFHIPVIYLDGRPPLRFGVRINDEKTIADLCAELGRLADVDACVLLNLNVHDLSLKRQLSAETSLKTVAELVIYAFELPPNGQSYVLSVQRRLDPHPAPFLQNARFQPTTFNAPVLVPVDRAESSSTNEHLYATVSQIVKRYIDEPNDEKTHGKTANRARVSHDNNRFPFVLRTVVEDAATGRYICAVCPWHRLCIGCPIPIDDQPTVLPSNSTLSIDWDINSLHLRYRNCDEYSDTASVAAATTAHQQPLPLHSFLETYTRPEEMAGDNAIECSKCDKKTDHTLFTWLLRLPPVLILQMIRFKQQPNGRVIKATQRIDAPLRGLDLSPYLHSSDEDTIYDCIAVVNHYGTTTQGHYTTYAKNSLDDKWYHFNDSRVKEVTEAQVDRQMAYLLFYERRSTPPTDEERAAVHSA